MDIENSKWGHIRSVCWNLMLTLVSVLILYFSYKISMKAIRPEMPLTDIIKLIGISLGLPVLFVLAIYERINKETVGIILTAIVSFSLGQAIK